MFGRKRKQALQALGEILAIANDYIYDETDSKRFVEAAAVIGIYCKDRYGDKAVEIAKQVVAERHPADNSSPTIGGEAND